MLCYLGFFIILISILHADAQYGGYGGGGGSAYGITGYGGGSSFGSTRNVATHFPSRPLYVGGLYFPPAWTFGFPGAPILPFYGGYYGAGGFYGGSLGGGGYGGGGYGGGGGGGYGGGGYGGGGY